MPQQNLSFNECVEALIELGKTGKFNQVRLDSSRDTQKKLMATRELWDLISNSLPEEELCHIIKGFVLYDKVLAKNSYGLGGSIAPATILCKRYSLRFSEKEEDLMSGVVDNRVNPYLPFGSMFYNNYKSFREYNKSERLRDAERRKRVIIESRLQQERKKAKKQKDLVDAKKNLPDAVRRGDIKAVIAIVEKGIDLTLLKHNGKPLFEYAEECENIEIINYLKGFMNK